MSRPQVGGDPAVDRLAFAAGALYCALANHATLDAAIDACDACLYGICRTHFKARAEWHVERDAALAKVRGEE